MDKLEFIIPIYNEESCLEMLMSRLKAIKQDFSEVELHILFINDGSRDNSLPILIQFAQQYDYLRVINLSRNFGHQFALTAGIDHCDADYACIIDADLQDPPELVKAMYKKAKDNSLNIVFGQRMTRSGESIFKKVTAMLFYRIINLMCKVEIPKDTGDFRLIDKKVIKALKEMKELHRFIRGMVPWVGFKSEAYQYERDSRYAGETKYTLTKMIRFAMDGIFSFSRKPLRIASYLGLIVACLGFIGISYMVYLKLFTNDVVEGITVILASIALLGGVQLLILGILGEYIGRIFEQTKDRPLYIIDTIYSVENKLKERLTNV